MVVAAEVSTIHSDRDTWNNLGTFFLAVNGKLLCHWYATTTRKKESLKYGRMKSKITL